jgi:hypothetical protein
VMTKHAKREPGDLNPANPRAKNAWGHILVRQQRFVAVARAAWAQVVTPELLEQLLVAMDHAQAALDPGLAVESPSGAYASA